MPFKTLGWLRGRAVSHGATARLQLVQRPPQTLRDLDQLCHSARNTVSKVIRMGGKLEEFLRRRCDALSAERNPDAERVVPLYVLVLVRHPIPMYISYKKAFGRGANAPNGRHEQVLKEYCPTMLHDLLTARHWANISHTQQQQHQCNAQVRVISYEWLASDKLRAWLELAAWLDVRDRDEPQLLRRFKKWKQGHHRKDTAAAGTFSLMRKDRDLAIDQWRSTYDDHFQVISSAHSSDHSSKKSAGPIHHYPNTCPNLTRALSSDLV
jgi:hypothetical protein